LAINQPVFVCSGHHYSLARGLRPTISEEADMARKEFIQILSVIVSLVLIIGPLPIRPAYQSFKAAPADVGAPTAAAAQSPSELKALVAPIALYPDNLVAIVLAGATFPDQIALADQWRQQHKDITGDALKQAVDKESWDDSVKALTAFPSVLDNMAKNLAWTSQLGEAYHNQKSELMAAIQDLRKQAKAAGHLKSTPQMTVEQENPQTIVIEPPNPQVVYVPEYNPAVVYGTPYVTPDYTPGAVAATAALSFGTGIAMSALMSGGWGWGGWHPNWSGGTVVHNGNTYIGNRAWHGAYHPYGFDGGYHPYGYGHDYHPYANRSDFNRNLNHFSDANSWANHRNLAAKPTAFSGLSSHAGGLGGWASRAHSFRGWGSMHASGFGGFHGGFHGFGGFHGGGFHGGRR